METGLKKGYSSIEQALNMYYADEGIKLTAGKTENTLKVKRILTKYMVNAYDCGDGYTSIDDNTGIINACLPNNLTGVSQDQLRNEISYRNFNNTNDIYLGWFDDGQYVATDGMLILVDNSRANNYQIFISVDVNGFRNPNRLGQDLFMFDLGTDGVLRPMGAPGTLYTDMNTYCSATSSSNLNGAACTYKAFTDKKFFRNLPK